MDDTTMISTDGANIWEDDLHDPVSTASATGTMVFFIIFIGTFLFTAYAYKREYSDVLSDYNGGRAFLKRMCGGTPIFSVSNFDLCKYLMTSKAAQERVVPPVLFANVFRRPHGTGICTSSGRKHELLKRMMHEMLDGTNSVLFINECASQVMQLMARKAGNERMPITRPLVESWVISILMPLIFDLNFPSENIWETDVRQFEEALDNLFDVREQLGKLVYDMNCLNSLIRCVHHCTLLYKYNIAREMVENMLTEGRYFRMKSFTDLGYTREDFTSEDLMETYIETLLYCKKKLGYAVYIAVYEIAGKPHWVEALENFISKPVNRPDLFQYIDETTEDNRAMLALIYEVLRTSEQRFCCHLRRTTEDFTFNLNSVCTKFPKGSVCHIAHWYDKKNQTFLFSPLFWLEDFDFRAPMHQRAFEQLAPFGKGIRECPARNFSCHVIFCFMAHVVRTGRVVLEKFFFDGTPCPIAYLPRAHFSDRDNWDSLGSIGKFWVKGRIP